jgi:hypothetical protein
MKIEIGESLVSSYLNHVEQCRIVQTNWRVSGNWAIGEQESLKPNRLFQKVLSNKLFGGVFKESSFEQLIKQAEIDVLGINAIEHRIYAYDIAFHSSGLNYSGGKQTSCETVIKKIFRSIFALQIYFPEFEKIESFFVTPKTNKSLDELLKRYIHEARGIIEDENIVIGYISNDDFFQDIVDPVLEVAKDENDTSELFLRAIKLSQLDKRIKLDNTTIPSKLFNRQITEKRTENGMKIGQYVKNSIFDLSRKGYLNQELLRALQDIDYCKSVIGIGFPILIKNGDITRYYKDSVVPGYWLCSQWTERHWDKYLDWEKKVKGIV